MEDVIECVQPAQHRCTDLRASAKRRKQARRDAPQMRRQTVIQSAFRAQLAGLDAEIHAARIRLHSAAFLSNCRALYKYC